MVSRIWAEKSPPLAVRQRPRFVSSKPTLMRTKPTRPLRPLLPASRWVSAKIVGATIARAPVYFAAVRVAFVVADVLALKPGYATLHLAQAAARRGHEVRFVNVSDLTLGADDQVLAHGIWPALPGESVDELRRALASEKVPAGEELLSEYDVVFLRYHPEREPVCPGNPAIDLGWRISSSGPLVVNDPAGTQRAGGRMYLAGLPADIRPRMLVTREPAKIKAFLRALDAPAVLKPLSQTPSDRANVFYVARGQVKNINQMIAALRARGYIVAQEYLPEAEKGEKRLLLLDGEPIRVGSRVAIYRRFRAIPAKSTNRAANSESVRKRCEFGTAEEHIAELVGPKLRDDGLFFVGLDLAGSKVLEVNVYTPGGLRTNLELYGIDVADLVMSSLERRVAGRRSQPEPRVATRC